MKRLILATIIIFSCFNVNADFFCRIKKFSSDEGFLQEHVTNFTQDSKGFIWFGTWNGLVRYDGYSFQTFKSLISDNNFINNSRIYKIQLSQTGNIWCITESHRLYLFDARTCRFSNVSAEINVIRDKKVDNIFSLANGYTWVAFTNGGCIRIKDSSYSTCYKYYPPFSSLTKGNIIYGITLDNRGKEWICSNRGVGVVGESFSCNYPFNYVEMINNYIFLASGNGKFAYVKSGTKYLHLITTPIPIHKINQLIAYNARQLILATDNGVMIYDMTNGHFKVFHLRAPGQNSDEATSVYIDSHKRLWAFSKGPGVNLINPENNEYIWLSSSRTQDVTENTTYGFCYQNKYGNIIVRPNGCVLAYYDESTRTLKECKFFDYKEYHSYDQTIILHKADQQGNLWVTSTKGIACISFYKDKFYPNNTGINAITRALFRDSMHRLWVGNKDGNIYLLDQNYKKTVYLNAQGSFQSGKTAFSSKIYYIYEDNKHRMWIATKGYGLYILTPVNQQNSQYKITHFTYDTSNRFSINSNDIYSVFQDKSGRIWIGTYGGGVNLFDERTPGTYRFINRRNFFKQYPSGGMKVRCISQDSNGVMLAGTTGGLVTFSTHNLFNPHFFVNTYKEEENNATTLKGRDIRQIIHIKNKIYLCVFGYGISEITSGNLLSDHLSFMNYMAPQNTSAGLILAAISDYHSNIWLFSESSVTRFSTLTKTYSNFDDTQLGVPCTFTEALPIINKGEYITAGTFDGMLSFYANDIRPSSKLPRIVFTGIQLQGDNFMRPVNDLNELTLSPSQRSISLFISSFDFEKSSRIRYAYKLDGYDKNWNYTNGNNSMSYINLPPGDYKLYVRSCNAEGTWLNNFRVLNVHVTPLFTETVFCKILYILIIMLILAALIYFFFYTYKLRHQTYMEQEISDARINLFTDISNELRTPLTLICGPTDELLQSNDTTDRVRNRLELIHKNALRISQLINHIFDFRKLSTANEQMIVEEEDIMPHLKHIVGWFREITLIRHIDINLKSDSDHIKLWVDKGKFEKIIFNLLSNICKYTSDGQTIEIRVKELQKTCQISIMNKKAQIPSNQFLLYMRYIVSSIYIKMMAYSDKNLVSIKHLLGKHKAEMNINQQKHGQSQYILTFRLGNEHFVNDPDINLVAGKSSDTATKDNEVDYFEDETDDDKTSILIIEDNADMRLFLISILRYEYNLITTSNGDEGLKLAEEKIPNFIISDINMPLSDNMKIVHTLKSNRLTCHIPVIMLSNENSVDDNIKGFKSGADDYIVKPFSSSYLKSRIANLINQRRMLQQKYMEYVSDMSGTDDNKLEFDFPVPQMEDYDKEFLNKFMEFFKENISQSDLIIEDFANALNMSRTAFYCKMKSIVGVPPVDFIKQLRIKRAIQLFNAGETSISQVAYLTGFSDPKYFSKCFSAEMNESPSKYLLKNKKHDQEDKKQA